MLQSKGARSVRTKNLHCDLLPGKYPCQGRMKLDPLQSASLYRPAEERGIRAAAPGLPNLRSQYPADADLVSGPVVGISICEPFHTPCDRPRSASTAMTKSCLDSQRGLCAHLRCHTSCCARGHSCPPWVRRLSGRRTIRAAILCAWSISLMPTPGVKPGCRGRAGVSVESEPFKSR